MGKPKSAVKYFIGKSFMRGGFIRVSIYPKRPEVMKRVFEALKSAGYVESDRETWLRQRKGAHNRLNKVRSLR